MRSVDYGVVTLDRILAVELLELLRAHERYHNALDVMRSIRHDDLVTTTTPLTRETQRVRDELERAIAQ